MFDNNWGEVHTCVDVDPTHYMVIPGKPQGKDIIVK